VYDQNWVIATSPKEFSFNVGARTLFGYDLKSDISLIAIFLKKRRYEIFGEEIVSIRNWRIAKKMSR
jgi:hypothetical protein